MINIGLGGDHGHRLHRHRRGRDPILWGVAYGVLNFLPIIGPTTIIISSALVGFATADTPTGADPAAGDPAHHRHDRGFHFVQPWLLGRRLVVSPIAIFVTIAVLVWMWGAPAAITAVPILIFLHTVLMHQPHLKLIRSTLLAMEKMHRHDKSRLSPGMRPVAAAKPRPA